MLICIVQLLLVVFHLAIHQVRHKGISIHYESEYRAASTISKIEELPKTITLSTSTWQTCSRISIRIDISMSTRCIHKLFGYALSSN